MEAAPVVPSRRSAVLVAVVLAAAVVLAGCRGGSVSGSGGGGSSGSSGRVVFGELADWPSNLMPLTASSGSSAIADVEAQVFPQAFVLQPDLTPKYDSDLLTAEPSSSVDGGTQTVTYRIDPDATWSDGQRITEKDFAFSAALQRSTDPSTGGCAAVRSDVGYSQITSVTGSDGGTTVRVELSPPFADWKSLFSTPTSPLLPAHVMDKGSAEANCEEVTAGWPIAGGIPDDISGGAWQLKKADIDVGAQTAVLTPNPRYHGARAKLAQLVVQKIDDDPTTIVQGLKSGQLSVVYPEPGLDLVGDVKNLAPAVTSTVGVGLTSEQLVFNTLDPSLADTEVRQAFATALDRQQIAKQTVGQFTADATVLDNRIWLTNQPQYKDDAPAQYRTQDTAQAKAVLESDGYALDQNGLYAKDGRELTFAIDTTPDDALRQQAVEVMVPQLRAAGIGVSYHPDPDLLAGPETPDSLAAGGFQIALLDRVGSPFIAAGPSLYESPQAAAGTGGSTSGTGATSGTGPTSGTGNVSRTGTSAIDQLLAKWVTETDPTQIATTGNDIDAALWQQMATIPLFQEPTFVAYRSGITNVQANPTLQGPLWNSSTWQAR